MRIEHDHLLGDKAIPDDVYYGVQTARALENFHISGVPISEYPDLIRALAMVKLAAARANYECKQFGQEILHGLEQHCVGGITANSDICRRYVEHSIGMVTALNPLLGYEIATELAAEALKTGKGIVELVREKKLLSEEQISSVLDPRVMTGAGDG